MNRYEPEYFKLLAKQLRFALSDAEAKDIADEFGTLLDQMHLLDKIDTEGVEEMIYPIEDETTFMREDIVGHTFTVEEALSNAPRKANDHFVTVKVVG
jgi:aspartyl-tRNA(Asn)/glutamyl-tRNA(Gln) amidotransferase subunit C